MLCWATQMSHRAVFRDRTSAQSKRRSDIRIGVADGDEGNTYTWAWYKGTA